MRKKGWSTRILLSAVMLTLLKTNVSAQELRNVSGHGYVQPVPRTWSGEEVEQLVQELEAEAEKAVDEAYDAGYDSGYCRGSDDAFASVKKRTFRERAGDWAFGFAAGAGTCLAVGITVRLQ